MLIHVISDSVVHKKLILNVKFLIANGENEKPLGIEFDCKLTFDEHISDFCKKASRKLNVLNVES